MAFYGGVSGAFVGIIFLSRWGFERSGVVGGVLGAALGFMSGLGVGLMTGWFIALPIVVLFERLTGVLFLCATLLALILMAALGKLGFEHGGWLGAAALFSVGIAVAVARGISIGPDAKRDNTR